ncbi:hypothetical protein [Bradyrhizobium betae]|uniref:Uncharacterized protein n=1 Tax=Bradyrhizobium betae TaxID=244734 RepID=A0A4Q1UNN9_9BRAD|nr:hypothetical protein [Bradyrhizobium betae]RXT37822.1 hypothetical protein B5V03_31735 [Bradyrhizobium betae]
MDETVRFVPKSERERARLIRGARAIYDSIFPAIDLFNEHRDRAPINYTVSDADVHRSNGILLP